MPETLVNPFFNQWGAPIVCTALLGLCSPIYLWLIKQNKSDIQMSLVSIKSSLSKLFQSVIIEEVSKIFELISDSFPTSISQADKSLPHKSKFDVFIKQVYNIEEIDEESPIRRYIAQVLQKNFGDILKEHLVKMIGIIKKECEGGDSHSNNSPYTELRFNFDGNIEKIIHFLAWKISQAEFHAEHHITCKDTSLKLFYISIAAIIFLTLSIVFDVVFIKYLFYLSISAFSVMIIVGIYMANKSYNSKKWIESIVEKKMTANDWLEEVFPK
ncbi:MAG: hypothetical protein P9X24_07585 [Candidatus Hatepunaea meridiana]|nr:hypothetical protein [Candidatus Hatepunaea meridiana]